MCKAESSGLSCLCGQQHVLCYSSIAAAAGGLIGAWQQPLQYKQLWDDKQLEQQQVYSVVIHLLQ
jgi:hypothetical protein